MNLLIGIFMIFSSVFIMFFGLPLAGVFMLSLILPPKLEIINEPRGMNLILNPMPKQIGSPRARVDAVNEINTVEDIVKILDVV